MKNILSSIRLMALTLILCCILYPLAVLGFGRLFAPGLAEGSLVRNGEGEVIGSTLIAQRFTRAEYFRSRPSAVDYDAAAGGGSNLSPANPELAKRVRDVIGSYDPAPGNLIPADLVTASGSGLDPHITLAAARFQSARIARARNLDPEQIDALIRQSEEIPLLKIFGGQPVVNVLRLNLALDAASSADHR